MRESEVGRKRRPLSVKCFISGLMLAFCLAVFGATGSVSAQAEPSCNNDPAQPNEQQCTLDVDGTNDSLSQSSDFGQGDLNSYCSTCETDVDGTPTELEVSFTFDNITAGGGDLEAGIFIDTDGDGFANYVLFVEAVDGGDADSTVDSATAILAACPDDDEANECPSGGTSGAGNTTQPYTGTCSVSIIDDEFGETDQDAEITCGIPYSDLEDSISACSDVGISNVCTLSGNSISSQEKDCVSFIRPSSITIVKVTDPADATDDFVFAVDGVASTNGTMCSNDETISGSGSVSFPVPDGTYSIAETLLSSYDLTDASCINADGLGLFDDLDSVDGILLSGDDVTCTFMNALKTASLTLVKSVINNNGGTAAPDEWTLTANGTDANDLSGSPADGENSISSSGLLAPDTFILSESGPLGYSQTNLTCVGAADLDLSDGLTLQPGEDVTCTFVNDDMATSLTVEKTITSDNGGTATLDEFDVSVDGTEVAWDDATSMTGGTKQVTTLAGTYSLSEGSVAGYDNGTWSCSGAADTDVSDGNITVALGESVTCSITNNDKATSLTVEKIITSDNGGTATLDDFDVTVDGTEVVWDDATSMTGGSKQVATMSGTYSLSEGSVAGYDNGTWSCSGAADADVSDGSITVGLGESVICSITNNDKATSLTIEKIITSDNGGTATLDDFDVSVDGTEVPWDDATSMTGSSKQVTTLAGTYALSEGSVSGYNNGTWSCSGATDTDVNDGNITVALGESVTCSITNNDDAPSLILAKTVVNDNGGSASAADWNLSAGSNTVEGSDTGTQATDQAGTYALSEADDGNSNTNGYTQTSLTCSDNPGVEVTSVTLNLGDTITCTFINNDDAPSLILAKTVINDNGGSASASDWDLNAGSYTVEGSDVGTLVTNQAGTYTLTEADDGNGNTGGYTQTSLSCSDNPGVEVTSVTLNLGDTITCTFVNNDDAPSLILVKTVINDNGGTASASNWDLSAGTYTVEGSPAGTQATDQAGIYALSEADGGNGNTDGYTQTSLTCSDDPDVEVTSVSLDLGETITCTFVNDDIAPSLTLVKVVDGNNAGDPAAAATAWTLSANGPGDSDITGATGSVAVTDAKVDAGTYTLDESGGPTDPPHLANDWSCVVTGSDPVENVSVSDSNQVSLGLGDDVTCTITNTEVEITIDKQIRTLPDGEWMDNLNEVLNGTDLIYRFVVTNTGAEPLVDVNVTDPALAGWLGLPEDFVFCSYASLAVDASEACGPFGPITAINSESAPTSNTAAAEGCAESAPEVCDTDSDTSSYIAAYWGFTPGFWKNHASDKGKNPRNAWAFCELTDKDGNLIADARDAKVGDIFTSDALSLLPISVKGRAAQQQFADFLLLEALSLQGGKGNDTSDEGAIEILLRAAVASYMNACFHETQGNPIGEDGVWPLTTEQIVSLVNDALESEDRQTMLDLASTLDGYNNGIDYINWDGGNTVAEATRRILVSGFSAMPESIFLPLIN